MSSTYGEFLKLSIFGQSHGPAIGMTLDGIPAGLPVDLPRLGGFLERRAPGRTPWSTPRRETDMPEFLSGILDGYTCGAPIAAVIHNENTRSGDYQALRDCPRPGHADYTAEVKYGGFQDAAGGGHFSGRLTAPLCVAGGLCLQWLEALGVRVAARIVSIGEVWDETELDPLAPDVETIGKEFPVVSPEAGERMKKAIALAHEGGDSLGGTIECWILGLPAGIGEPMFGGVESRIAQIIYGIPAVKAVEFGEGTRAAGLRGSRHNDEFLWEDGRVRTRTNHCGGILGGITNGMPVYFRVTMKPTPSIAIPQQTVNLAEGNTATLRVPGRHDPCIVPRAVPVVEAAAGIAVYDLILGNTATNRRKNHGFE